MNDLIQLKNVPDLETFEIASIDLSNEYWTPDEPGERRRMIFCCVETRSAPSHNDPDKEIDLLCAVFVQPSADGEHKTVINGSKRLVAAFENNSVEQGTPVQVTYKGKMKNKSNAYMSDSWVVQLLEKKGGE